MSDKIIDPVGEPAYTEPGPPYFGKRIKFTVPERVYPGKVAEVNRAEDLKIAMRLKCRTIDGQPVYWVGTMIPRCVEFDDLPEGVKKAVVKNMYEFYTEEQV